MSKVETKDIKEISNLTDTDILYFLIPTFEKQLAKVNKKLTKKGISPITVDYGEPYWDERLIDDPGAMHGYRRIRVKMVTVTVHHEIPVLKEKGFEFVGAVSFKKGVKTIFNNTDDITFFDREIDFLICNHCNTRRYRNTISFFRLLKNKNGKKKGDLVQIGSTCSKDYFGLDLIKAITAGCDFIYNSFGNPKGLMGSYSYTDYIHFEALCAASYIVLDDDKRYIGTNGGYYDGPVPTSVKVSYLLDRKNEDGRKEVSKLLNSKEWDSLYKKIVDHWIDLKVTNDFESNVKERFVNYNVYSEALIACGVWTVIKGDYESKKDSKKRVNNFIGKVGDSLIDNVTVNRHIPFNGPYGPGLMIQMVTDEGYTLKWFTSYSKKSDELFFDVQKTISYTVKDLNEYNGYKSTIIKVKKIVDLGEKIDPEKNEKTKFVRKEVVNPFKDLSVPSGRKWTKEKVQAIVRENDDAANWVVLTTYNHQTEDEKRDEYTREYNCVGFSGLDGEFGTSLAKSIIKFGQLSDKQKPYGLKMALKYSGQFAKHLNREKGL